MLEQIKELVAENLGADITKLSEETNLVEELNADSLDIVELTMAIEEQIGIKIEDEDIEKVKTIGDIVKYIEERK